MKSKKAPANGAAPKRRIPKWKRYPEDYRTDELSRVEFATSEDIDEAIGIIWGGLLTGIPFELGGDGMSLIVPKGAIPFFLDAGLRFTELIVTS